MNSPSSFHITSPTDLLALVPNVLGFHPEESLVLVVTAGRGGNLHARVDLVPADDVQALDAVRSLVTAVARIAAHSVALIAYSDDEVIAEEMVELLVEQLEVCEVEVVCAIRADGERWYPLDCGPDCCPTEGVSYDLSSHPITAQSVLDGRVTYGSRRELAESLVGTDLDAIEAVRKAADDAVRRFEGAARRPLGPGSLEGARAHAVSEGLWVRGRLRRWLRTGETLDNEEVGRVVAALLDIEVRDVAWAEMTRSNALALVALWRDLVRRTPLDLLPAPAALLAFAAWLAGDGALAWCAVERCQEAEPGYTMAGLVSQALSGAVHPSAWQPIRPEDLPLFAG